jgi:hypothetical protein
MCETKLFLKTFRKVKKAEFYAELKSVEKVAQKFTLKSYE